jgi:3-oxoadipate enol-lactonase
VVIAPESVRLLAETVPNGRFVQVPRAGHSVYFERADVFNEALGAFLDEIDGGGRR